MPPVWRERLARVRQANDANFGEACSITPMTRNDRLGNTPDPDRQSFNVVGVLQTKGGDTSGQARPAQEDEQIRMPVGDINLHVDPDVYPLILGATTGDVVTALDRGGARYEVERVDRGMRNRLVFRLRVIL